MTKDQEGLIGGMFRSQKDALRFALCPTESERMNMKTINDDVVIGLVKGKIGEMMDRMDRERPELSQEDREAATVRLGQQEIALALASRPDLAKRFSDMAAECFLRAITRELRSLRST